MVPRFFDKMLVFMKNIMLSNVLWFVITYDIKPFRFWPFLVLWIQTKNFGSGFGFRSGLKLVSDPDQIQIKSDPIWIPIQNWIPGIRIQILDSDTDQQLAKNFYPASSLNIKMLLSLSSVTWLQSRCVKICRIRIRIHLVRGTDPRIWIRTKMSQIHNTAYNYL